MLRNIPEERKSHQHRGGSLKSRLFPPSSELKSTLTTEGAGPSEMSIWIHRTTWHRISDNSTIHTHRDKNLKSHKPKVTYVTVFRNSEAQWLTTPNVIFEFFFHFVFTVHFHITLINHQHNALCYDKVIYYLFIYPDMFWCLSTPSSGGCPCTFKTLVT
jgi:hypothetical protein